jgi:hypothetical protein
MEVGDSLDYLLSILGAAWQARKSTGFDINHLQRTLTCKET